MVSKLPYLPVSEIFDKLEEICKDRTRFSENDEDESAIFVEMYKSGQLQIKRMTKSSFMCVMQK